MARAWQFQQGNNNSDLIIENLFELAAAEIYATYGDIVKLNRKTLRKYGQNPSATNTEQDIAFLAGTETRIFTNGIDTISSDDASDTGLFYLEGHTISGTAGSYELTFVTQNVMLNGQNKVTLDTPLARATRARAVTAGDVYVYEDTAITAGVPNDLTKAHMKLSAADSSSLNSNFSIAKNNYFLIIDSWATTGRTGNANCSITLKIANLNDEVLGTNFYTEQKWAINQNSPYGPPTLPLDIITPNSDVKLTCQTSSGTFAVNGGVNGVFADIIN